MKKYSVSDECISCRACVEVASDFFEMNSDDIAYLKNQPENENQISKCDEAMDACPVNAISSDSNSVSGIEPVVSKSNIKETLDKYPVLKDVLVKLSPKFKRMQNVAVYNTLARFANFNDAARVTGVSVCEILHTINKHLGVEEKLINSMPECVSGISDDVEKGSVAIDWEESAERYIYNKDTIEELIKKVSELESQKNIVILSVEKPIELIKVATGLDFIFNFEFHREYRISIFNPKKDDKQLHWHDRKDEFEILDVRKMKSDPFDIIVKKGYEIAEDDGFTLIQKFEPAPMISMLEEMGFDYLAEEKGFLEVWVYFHKKVTSKEEKEKNSKSSKVDVVIQSATPVAYPVMMRLLQSKKIRESINIKELKVWEETEKHLAWITSGKADISFSALITSAKLSKSDIKIPALFVWDNFVILSRQKVEGLADIKGKDIYTPLFEEAPPAKITKYLIKASGLEPNDFNFVFGKPFGRPEEIFQDFVTGKADTVILREPEASYAIKIMQDRNEHISIISYNKIWNEINKGFGSFPNAGLVLKGEFARKNPELVKVFLDELESAIEWVNNNRAESAKLSYDMMRQPVDRVELFLNRVNFDYVSGDQLIDKVKQYFEILNKQEIVNVPLDEKFLSIFKM